MARLPSGRVVETADFERWQASQAVPPRQIGTAEETAPEPEATGVTAAAPGRRYAWRRAVHRSDDDGKSWVNVTHHRGRSILGAPLLDLAVSPVDPDELVLSTGSGVWRSLDGGLTWSGLNDALPNLPARKILAVRPVRVQLDTGEAEWRPGQPAWQVLAAGDGPGEEQLRSRLAEVLGGAVSAAHASGDWLYGGLAGRLMASSDRGRTWQSFGVPEASVVTAIVALREDPRVALASLAPGDDESRSARVLRTTNGGLFWDDLTANLPAGPVYGITADFETGAIYAATGQGVFGTYGELRAAGPATLWQRLTGSLPEGPALDVRLDEAGNQIYVLMEGTGVFSAMAPHRWLRPRLVNAADRTNRPAAPGGLLSVLGSRVTSVRAGNLEVPVLAATDGESQIQIPFEVRGESVSLALNGGALRNMTMPLRPVSPAIFVDREGAPMILDADKGVLLEPGTPARAGTRIQILAAGMGRVNPDWPTGTPAPATQPPEVVAPVRVYLDRVPLAVTRATLAPGFVGLYLIEVHLPEIVNNGPAELFLESGGQSSRRVSLWLLQ